LLHTLNLAPQNGFVERWNNKKCYPPYETGVSSWKIADWKFKQQERTKTFPEIIVESQNSSRK
jgi:hypothetical protein